ncbi:MAG: Filamentous hemagglutinin family outer membrane protein [Pedosphaera sp.]|nr:Filamentous hemagglutinin family outer membrane protein [Pedosphaera sp.]
MKTRSILRFKSRRVYHLLRRSGLLALAGLLADHFANLGVANPVGMVVTGGTATFTQSGSQVTVNLSQVASLDWRSFNIASGETTTFIQPSSTSVVWDRILDQNPSQILGHLNSNGYVVLWNQNGFYFGPNSVVNVGGLVVTTVPIGREPNGPSTMWQYNGPPPLATIVNYGEIKAQTGGSIFIVAEKIENNGTLSAPGGAIGLYAGQQVLITERPDGRGLAASVTLPAGSIDNNGKIIADAGTIALSAQVVNQNGLVQANSVREHNGTIELLASDAINLGNNSVLSASGGASGSSAGGSITIKSDGSFSDTSTSLISVAGGAQGGTGGHVEISASLMPSIQSQIDGHAIDGELGGSLNIDPDYIILSKTGTGSAGTGTVNAGDPPGSLNLNVNTAFKGFSQIDLQAKYDITLAQGTVWNLNTSTGIGAAGSLLSLQAGRNIIFNNGASITSASGWSVQLAAGSDFSSPLSVVKGQGGIYLNGSADGSVTTGTGSIQTGNGSIQLAAGKEVLVGTGFIGTTAGGSISITALSGSIDAGRGGNHLDGSTAYQWQRNGTYIPFTATSLSGIGGIDTLAGGDITLNAGGDIRSRGPTSGTYGLTQSANMNLTAGGSIYGRFQVADGTGTINAGVNFGSASSPASLSLITGGWQVHAGHDIILEEVLNPRGVFSSQALVPFQFDYSPIDWVSLNGGNSVQLMGDSPLHTADNPSRLPIYPPILDIQAGAGGVHLGNDVILFPSPMGSLTVTTTDGGALYGGAPLTANDAPQLQPNPADYARLIVSDSGSSDYSTFDTGHAATPVHLATDGPSVQLDISGDVQNLYVQSPTEAIMHVHGNARNFSYSGQNLAAGDTTRLTIDGDFLTRSTATSVSISGTPNASIFDPLTTQMPQLGASLTYNPVTHQLTIQGILTAAQLNYLLHPMVAQLDAGGSPILDSHGNPVLVAAAPYSTDTAALNQLYQLSQNIPPPQAYAGIQVGGPGTLAISAKNMDLGVTQGIRTVGALNNPNLAGISLHGADISIQLAGNLDMTSSQIASFNGGNIDVTAGGSINVGAQQQFSSDDTPKGIYTGHGGNVTVTAADDIEVNGSRIATYDGGNVTVVSQHGSVDAGNGGESSFTIITSVVDPVTGLLGTENDTFFSSGIVALTAKNSQSLVGNISITAAKNISANAGGVLQISLNGVGVAASKGTVKLDAGGDINANLSGIVGQNVNLKAGGNIVGQIVATQNILIGAGQNANVTAVGGGSVSVGASGTVSGSVIGGGNVTVSGNEISASVASTAGSVSTSGDTKSAQIGAFAGVAAPAVAQQTSQEADKTIAEDKTDATSDEDEFKKHGTKSAVLVKSSGRVTVILPKIP